MEQNTVLFRNKGMYQDPSVSKSSDEFAFKNVNIRITAVNDTTQFSVTNEKLPSSVSFKTYVGSTKTDGAILGQYLGRCIIGDYLVLFTHEVTQDIQEEDVNIDRIYRCWIEGSDIVYKELVSTDLGFVNPIEAVGSYEREDIIKVYWVDGHNSNRVINVMAETQPNSFDFLPVIGDNLPLMSVEKNPNGLGAFPSGTIQYFVSYYNTFGQETKILNSSELVYITTNTGGGAQDSTINCSFSIDIQNINSQFEYLRLYSATRTSIDGPLSVNIVCDIPITSTSANIVDTGKSQDAIDSSILLYAGGDNFIASTLEDKDNVLFFGNIIVDDSIILSQSDVTAIRSALNDSCISFEYRENESVLDSNIKPTKHFKFGNFYRFAIQFITDRGEQTDAVWFCDEQCRLAPTCSGGINYVPCVKFTWPSGVLSDIKSRYPFYRILIAETNNSNRAVVAQGVLNPTIFNIGERKNKEQFADISYITRPERTLNSMHLESLGAHYIDNHGCCRYDYTRRFENSEFSQIDGLYAPILQNENDIDNSYYYIDKSILTLNSPEIHYGDITSIDGLKFRIIGIANDIDTYRDYSLQIDNPCSKPHTTSSLYGGKLIQHSSLGTDENMNTTLKSDYMYGVSILGALADPLYPCISIWHSTGSLFGADHSSFDDYKESEYLKTKKFASYSKSLQTNYFEIFHYPDDDVIGLEIDNICAGLHDGLKDVIKTKPNSSASINDTKYIGCNYDKLLASANPYYVQYLQGGYNTFVRYGQSTSPVRIRASYSPCAIIDMTSRILPYMSGSVSQWALDSIYDINVQQPYVPVWDADDTMNYYQVGLSPLFFKYNQLDTIDISQFLFIGELYKDLSTDELYGNIDNLKWVPVGPIKKITENTLSSETEGDTFFQRWDCLRTVPYAEEDENSVIDIVSFMVETYDNVESSYSSNKGYDNMLLARQSNYNRLNPAYNQSNNIFRYNSWYKLLSQDKFPTEFAWSLNKSIASKTDSWSNTSLSNIDNVDGKYGKINAIEKLNDTLVCFQDKAICVINFNNRTQISTEQGTPIELANSGKVNGVTYITTNYGCKNKYSIVNAKTGLYFIDDENRALIRIGKDGLADISTSCGMSVWFDKANRYGALWNGGNLNNTSFVLQYDSNRGDIYIMTNGKNEENCIVYNEILGTFTSFFGYKYPLMWNEQGETYCFGNNNNNVVCSKLFGSVNYGNDYSIDYRVNPEPLVDKIFTNIEYIADMLDGTTVETPSILEDKHAFNKIDCWNEYQQASGDLTQPQYGAGSLKTKFRIRRVDIPRPSTNYGLDRMRNPWIHLKLYKYNSSDTELMEFHSLAVKYFKQ